MGRWAGSDLAHMWTGSAGIEEEGGTGTVCADGLAVGMMGGPLGLGDVGCTPGARSGHCLSQGSQKTTDLPHWPMAGVSCGWGHVWRGGSVLRGGSGLTDR